MPEIAQAIQWVPRFAAALPGAAPEPHTMFAKAVTLPWGLAVAEQERSACTANRLYWIHLTGPVMLKGILTLLIAIVAIVLVAHALL